MLAYAVRKERGGGGVAFYPTLANIRTRSVTRGRGIPLLTSVRLLVEATLSLCLSPYKWTSLF